MLLTLLGIVTLVRVLPPGTLLIVVTPSANVTVVIYLLSGKEIPKLGIVTLLRFVQPVNALPPMLVTLFGIAKLLRPLQP